MDFLEKLNDLMTKSGLNKSSLSKSCNIPYTTIDGWYKKGYQGLKLTTLRKLADFFGTTLDYWAKDGEEPPVRAFALTSASFNKLKPCYQEYLLRQIDLLLEIQRKEEGE